MDIIIDQLLSLATAMIEQAKKELTSGDDYLAMRAAMYFFLEPVQSDNDNLRTFAGLCTATQINADAAAIAIFDNLKSHQKRRIRSLLQNAGYNVRSKKPLPVG